MKCTVVGEGSAKLFLHYNKKTNSVDVIKGSLGSIKCHVNGNIHGNVNGNITGNVLGEVSGTVLNNIHNKEILNNNIGE